MHAAVRHESDGCVVLDVYDRSFVAGVPYDPVCTVVVRDDVSKVYRTDYATGAVDETEIATPGGLTVFLTRQRRTPVETAQRLREIGVLDE